MATKPIKFLELHYTMTQFLITTDIQSNVRLRFLSNYSVILLEFVNDSSLQETTVEPYGHFYNKDSSLSPRETRIHIMSSSNISDDDKVYYTSCEVSTKKCFKIMFGFFLLIYKQEFWKKQSFLGSRVSWSS